MSVNLLRLLWIVPLFITCFHAEAQCADVYIYMPKSFLETDESLDLYSGTTLISTIKEGTRLVATVCEGEYDFEVVNPELGVRARETLTIDGASEYYFKVSFTPGLTIPLMKAMSASKGRRDIASNAKFNSSLQSFTLTSSGRQTNTQQNPGYSSTNQSSGKTPRGQVFNIDGFSLEITDVSKAGSTIRFDMLITNNTGVVRTFSLFPKNMSFYDELGNYRSATEVCLGAECRRGKQVLEMDIYTAEQNAFFGGIRAEMALPTQIPIKTSFSIANVNERANKWSKGQMIFGHYPVGKRSERKSIYIPISNFELPTDIIPDRPLARSYKQHIIEITESRLSGNKLKVELDIENGSSESLLLTNQGAIAYTTEGVELVASGIYAGRIEPTGYYRNNDLGPFAPRQNGVITAVFDLNGNQPTQLAGLTITLDNVGFNWRDISVSGSTQNATPQNNGGGSTSTQSKYLSFNDFKSNPTSAPGKFIVLDKIYFATGSSNLLGSSYTQLDEVAGILSRNGNIQLEISGHTDDIGSDQSNIILSQKRADEVRYYLLGKGVSSTKISSRGYGSDYPRVPNTTSANRQENRRVEMEILK